MNIEREVEISTAPWILNPREAFEVMGSVNSTRPADEQVGIELYPGVRPPAVVTQEKIDEWRAQYGNVPVVRVHLPFHNDLKSAIKNWRHTKMNSVERFGIGPGLLYVMGTVSNMSALKIARAENAEVNAHVSVVEQAKKKGNLETIKKNSAGVYVENEASYSAADLKGITKARNPLRSIMSVRDNGLSGVIYGADHAQLYHLNAIDELAGFPQEYRDLIRTIHIAGAGHHGKIDGGNEGFRRLVNYKRQNFGDDVSFCVDMSPFTLWRGLSKMNIEEQKDFVQTVISAFER